MFGLVAIYSLTGPEHLQQLRNEMIPAVSEIGVGKIAKLAVVTNNGEVVTFGTSYVVQSAGGM